VLEVEPGDNEGWDAQILEDDDESDVQSADDD
jgi:hypothetical protein